MSTEPNICAWCGKEFTSVLEHLAYSNVCNEKFLLRIKIDTIMKEKADDRYLRNLHR